MGLSAPGVGSNLDVNGLVTQLMSIERQPLALIQKHEADVQAQLSAYGILQSQLASFGDAAAALGKAATMFNYTATVVDGEVGTATAGATAVTGSYSLMVNQLAKVEKLATGPFASATTVVGAGALTLTLGTYDSVGNTFNATAGKTPLTLNLTPSNNTLAGVRDAINAARAGFSATIVTESGGAHLVITSTDTGAKNAIKIDADPALAAFAFDPTVVGVQAVSELQTAQDAKLSIDNFDVVSASNQVTGAVDGVTINLAKAKPGQSTTLNVAQDTTTTAQALQQFVTSYNALNTLVRNDTKYDATAKVAGSLQGQVTAVSVISQMRAAISGAIAGASGDFTTLSDIGISLQTDGSLKLDSTKLAAATATASGSARLARLFVATASNPDTYVTRIKSFIDKTQGTDGLIPSKTAGLKATIKRLDREQADFNTRMVGVEAGLRRQFNALDANLASQNAITAYLTSQATAWEAAAKQ